MRDRLPSAPGIPGGRLPPPASVPPEERLLRELAALEGRVLGRLADQHAEGQRERVELRSHMGRLEQRQDAQGKAMAELTCAVLAARTTDVDHAGKLGELLAVSRSAGGKRGAAAAVGTVLTALGARWLANKLGIELP